MEISLKKQKLNYYSRELSFEYQFEETMELVVSDSLPDVVSVVNADGCVFLRGKEIDEGKLTINGSINCFVLYYSEGEKKLMKMPVQLPFTSTRENSAIGSASSCIVSLSITSLDARIINSRKLLLRAELLINADVFEPAELETPYETETDCALEVMKDRKSLWRVSSVGEQVFELNERLSLPLRNGESLEKLLKYRVALQCGDVTASGDKLVIKGSAELSLLYLTDEGNVGSAEINVPFTEICSMEQSVSGPEVFACAVATGVYFDEESEGGAELGMELSAVIQWMCCAREEVEYISDAYSICCQLEDEYENQSFTQYELGSEKGERSLVKIEDSAIKSLTELYIRQGRRRIDGTDCLWKMSVLVLYETENGEMKTVSEAFEIRCAERGGTEYDVKLKHLEISSKTISDGIEIQVLPEFETVKSEVTELNIPVSLELDETKAKNCADYPSLIVLRSDGETKLWNIAKTYNTSVAAILEANPELEGGEPQRGDLLLITRGKKKAAVMAAKNSTELL